MSIYTSAGAEFSDNSNGQELHRYKLWRTWNEALPKLIVIGLNPSIANDVKDDPTIRRIVGFAIRNGYGGFIMLNMFTKVTTTPFGLNRTRKAWEILQSYASLEEPQDVLFAWGADNAAILPRAGDKPICADVIELFESSPSNHKTLCFGLTKQGYPKHPLYLESNTPMIQFTGRYSKLWQS